MDKSGECWLWTGYTQNGYGRFSLNGSPVYAHRWAYEQENGPVPDGLVIDHLCQTKGCVRASHMEAVTLAENFRRAPNYWASRSACANGHPYTSENTAPGRSGRVCRTCARVYKRAYKARRRARATL